MGETSEVEAVEKERRDVDWVTGGYLVSHPDSSTTAPLVLSAPQARPPTPNDPPETSKGRTGC